MFFRNKNKNNPPYLLIDFHNHILPGVDDGSRSLHESMTLIEKMSALGYKIIVFSPHISVQQHGARKEKIISTYEQVIHILKEKFPAMLFIPAGEYMMDAEFNKILDSTSLLCFGQKKYVLIEFPLYHYHDVFLQHLQDLIFSGYTPILAHPERYWYIESDEWFIRLHEAGVLMQINFLSLTGYYGRDYQKKAEKLVQILPSFFLCSDLHHSEQLPFIEDFFKNYSTEKAVLNKILNQQLYEELKNEVITD